MTEKQVKERLDGPDLLRCVAMMMIVVLHFLGKGKLLPKWEVGGEVAVTSVIADLLESFAIVAVNVYMLISGYFLSASRFRLSRLITLYIQLWIYSVGVGAVCITTGLVPADGLTFHDLLILALPVSMEHYWFMTAYIFLYLLLPLLCVAVDRLSQKQLLYTIGTLVFFHSILKSVLPVRLDTDGKGYTFLWYLVVFLIAAYLRKFQPAFLANKGKCCALWLLGSFGTFAELMFLGLVYTKTGSLGYVLTVPLEYNHLLPLIASLGLFGLLLRVKLPALPGRVVRFIAPYTLGVYLLHENIRLRTVWPQWFGSAEISGVIELILRTVEAAILVFAVGILVDFLRKLLQDGIGKLLIRIPVFEKLWNAIRNIDSIFASEL